MSLAFKNNTLPQPSFINGEKGNSIALYRYPAPLNNNVPVVLTHGTFSNALTCAKLATYLSYNGFDCWVYEWSGHGQSKYGALYPDAEDFALNDVPTVIKTVLGKTNEKSCIWVANSGGGFLPLMYLARNPQQRHKTQRIVGIGSQTTEVGKKWIGKLIVGFVPILDSFLGKVPGPAFGLGPEDENSAFLKQWCQWNRAGQWIGKDGFNYYRAMKDIKIPAFLIAGSKDYIAPPNGCEKLFLSLGSVKKKFVLCSKEEGFSEDYNHDRLIACRNSQTEIWPMVLDFIT